MKMFWSVFVFLAILLLPRETRSQSSLPAQGPNCPAYLDRVVRVRIDRIQNGNMIYLNSVLGYATGSIIGRDSSDYRVLTAFHVVEPIVKNYQPAGDQKIVPDTSLRAISILFYDGRLTQEASVDWYDEVLDIAVLTVPRQKNIAPLNSFVFGNSDQINIGDPVFQLGHPLGFSYSVIKTMVAGKANAADFSLHYVGRRFQLQGIAGAGISGGPVLNERCELIGVSQFSAIDKVRGNGFDMALPINYVAKLLTLPKSRGRVAHAYLYITAVPVTDLAPQIQEYLKRTFGVREGALVTEVKEGSNAQKLGILVGDIIYKFGTHRVNTISDITDHILFEYKPGDHITLEMYRRDANKNYVKYKLDGTLTETQVNHYEK